MYDKDKAERLEQLHEWGYNTPRFLKIVRGSTIDNNVIRRLKKFAGPAKKMTVRTYSAINEDKEYDTDFSSEIETNMAIKKVKNLVPKYHVLFQEAIDKGTTLVTGNVGLKQDGSGAYDILKGPYRVRDVNKKNMPVISMRFNSIRQIKDQEMRDIINQIKDLPFLVPDNIYKKGVILEFDLHSEEVGRRKENLILYEYRKFE